MNRFRAMVCLVGAALIVFIVSGCGPAKEGPMGLVFYPSPPDPPKLQYLTTINNTEE
ncbi:MAG: hypothetical protein NT049_11675 [Planctomycetota bacterium]|nr:hypothetical protein [Planctomycetota bacterium]